jgi:hypothetical protein
VNNSAAAISHRRGATFSYSGLVKLPAGVWSAECELRSTAGILIDNLEVTLSVLQNPGPAAETHAITVARAAGLTGAWPVGTSVGDILFADGAGVVLATGTFTVAIVRGVTNAY